jgi:HYDIN/CFA65/VesB-like, Ig-like domain
MSDTGTQSEARRRDRRDRPRGWIARLGPTGIFVLAGIYLLALLLLAVGREAEFWVLGDLDDPIAGVLPLGVPWFGALGAVTLSLYGVFDHNDHWDRKWNYWHIARPFVGIVLAIVAYFIFITLIRSTGLTPQTSATTTTTETTATTTTTLAPGTTTGSPATQTTRPPAFTPQPAEQAPPPTTSSPDQTGENAPAASNLLIYYVLAFLVGFREQTFRNLIKRAADVLLGPGDPGAPPAGISVHPAPIEFGDVPVGTTAAATVTVTNTGTGDLQVYPSSAEARGTDLHDENGVFSITANAVEGATIAPGANATMTVEFCSETAGTYPGTLTISSNAGTNPIDLSGTATAEERRGVLRRRRGVRAARRRRT